MGRKVIKRMLLTMALCMGMTFGVGTAVSAAEADSLGIEDSVDKATGKVSNFKQTTATTTSISLSWDAFPGATQYKVEICPVSSSEYMDVTFTQSTAIKITGLKTNTKYDVRVAAGSITDSYWTYTYLYNCKTLPGKVAFAGQRSYPQTQKYSLAFKYYGSVGSVDGYQVTYTNMKTKGSKTINANKSSCTLPLKRGTFYKVTVKGYATINGTKKFGASRTLYLAQQPVLSKKSYTKSSMTVKWPKVTGTSNYTVYVSSKSNSGYKKVKTTTGTTYTHKNMKVGKTYYIYVKANRKAGGSTYSTPSNYYYSMKLYYY